MTSQIKEGEDFTLVLKENGTVWTYGNNGIIKTNEPVQIMQGTNELKNIKKIGAGNKISIALSRDGEVYIWGRCYKASNIETIKEPTKQDSLSNIISVEAYGDNFYALDSEGNVYVWGRGYSNPTKIESDIKYVEISGKILLRREWTCI